MFVLLIKNEQEILMIVHHEENKKSRGHGGLSNAMMKMCMPVSQFYLTSVINERILKVFSSASKITKVIVLHKSGNRRS